MVSWLNIEKTFFLNGFKSYKIDMYTNYLSKSNELANGFLICKEICMWGIRFYWPVIRNGFFRILVEVNDLSCWPKGSQPLGTRLSHGIPWCNFCHFAFFPFAPFVLSERWNRVEKLFLNRKPNLITRIRALREKGQFKPLWIPLLYFDFLDCLRQPSDDNTDTDDKDDTGNCDDNKCAENANDNRVVARECYYESPYFLSILLCLVILSFVLIFFT